MPSKEDMYQKLCTCLQDVFSFGVIMFETFSRYLTIMAISIQGTDEVRGDNTRRSTWHKQYV